jgi:hypothetical protein
VYLLGTTFAKKYLPLSFVASDREILVAVSVNVTVAPTMAPPDGSVTVPATVPVEAQIDQSQLLSKIQTFLELDNHHKINRMVKTIASQLPSPHEKVKPNALYKLSKINIYSSHADIRHAIFRYRVS